MEETKWGTAVERFFVKYLDICTVRSPDEDWPTLDVIKDAIMVFHHCEQCQVYRFERYFDPVSHNGHFFCGGCQQRKDARELPGLGMFLFRLFECFEVAFSTKHVWLIQWLIFWKIFLVGMGKYLPIDREGKTVGELNFEAGVTLSVIINRLPL